MPTDRILAVKIGEGDSRLVVELTGAECACEDLQVELVAFVSAWRREYQKRKPEKKPCGCGEVKHAH